MKDEEEMPGRKKVRARTAISEYCASQLRGQIELARNMPDSLLKTASCIEFEQRQTSGGKVNGAGQLGHGNRRGSLIEIEVRQVKSIIRWYS